MTCGFCTKKALLHANKEKVDHNLNTLLFTW